MKFRRLKASEIDVRVATVNKSGCTLLLYKDARVDMNLLDETVGSMNWKRSHQMIDGNLYCTVEVWDDEKKQWISKQDVGTESYTEKEKGQASDSFKRACFNLGIGRELYTAPNIYIPAGKVEIKENNGKYTTYDRFEVASIGYDKEGNINQLTICNKGTQFTKKNVEAFSYDGKAEKEDEKKTEKAGNAKVTEVQVKSIRETIKKANREDLTENGLCKYFKVEKLEDMTTKDLRTFLSMLNGD